MAVVASLLEGHVEYRLDIARTIAGNQNKRHKTSDGSRRQITAEEDVTPSKYFHANNAGFYLVVPSSSSEPHRPCSRSKEREYLLSVPLHLRKTVCDAARFRGRVRVSRYTVIPLDSGSARKQSRKRSHSALLVQACDYSTYLLEIHDNGLELLLLSFEQGLEEEQQATLFLTLEKLFLLEQKAKSTNNDEANDPPAENKKDKKRKRKSNRFNIQGVVDSISPIICIDGEPFALMELYDPEAKEQQAYSCVVVFQGTDVLACHDGIIPGDVIFVSKGKRQRWKIPDEVISHKAMNLQHRVPTHVFVVRNANDIKWRTNAMSKNNDMIIPPLVSTPIPLVSLQGHVVAREWASRGGSSSESKDISFLIHSIDIELLQRQRQDISSLADFIASGEKARHVLLLTYYPMSPALTLSLKARAVMQAVNIHYLGSSLSYENDSHSDDNHETPSKRRVVHYYGACLRSTLSILQMQSVSSMASENDDTSESSDPSRTGPSCSTNCNIKDASRCVNFMTQLPVNDFEEPLHRQSASSISSDRPSRATEDIIDKLYPSRALAFLSVQRSYFAFACRKQIYHWFYNKNNFQQMRGSIHYDMPSLEEISKAWWSHQFPDSDAGHYSPSLRNPYLEFFDHACDDGADSEPDSSCDSTPLRGGCRCSMRARQQIPCWVALHELQACGFGILQKRLEKALLERVHSLHVGWTATIELANSHIINIIQNIGEDSENHDHGMQVLYTGGTVTNSKTISSATHDPTEQFLSCASLADDHCVLPATTILNHDTPVFDSGHDPPNSPRFALGRLHGVAASCFCVKAPKSTDAQTELSREGEKEFQKNQASRRIAETQLDQGDNNSLRQIETLANTPSFLPLHDDFTPPNEVPGHHSNQPHRLSLRGACAVWQKDGAIFVLSIQLRFNSLIGLHSTSTKFPTDGNRDAYQSTLKISHSIPPNNPTWTSIQECLDPDTPISKNEEDDTSRNRIVGILARQRLRLSRISDNRYRGCVLTISHAPFNHAGVVGKLQSLSSLQHIEVKTTIHFEGLAKKKAYLKNMLIKQTEPLAESLDDAVSLILAWWSMADKPESCVLTQGGWDDLLPPSSRPSTFSFQRSRSDLVVVVLLPRAAAQGAEARGYERFTCPLSQISAGFLRIENHYRDSCASHLNLSPGISHRESLPKPHFDSMGGFKFLPGMLDRRPTRRIRSDDVLYLRKSPYHHTCALIKRELAVIPSPSVSGIPNCSLGEMIRFVCMELQNQHIAVSLKTDKRVEKSFLAPSLVRRVSGARNLGITFCQAQVVCTKCFQPLRQADHKEKERFGHSRGKNQSKNVWEEDRKQPSFWDRPLPIPGSDAPAQLPYGRSNDHSPKRTPTSPLNLCCPSGCFVDSHAEVKWECSCTIDDGTGQAKMYAEREAATMLLGISQSALDMIEDGAWKDSRGRIVFSRTAPPPSHLAKAVEAANFKYLAQEKTNKRQQKRNGSVKNEIDEVSRSHRTEQQRKVLDLLDSVDRAVYLLYQHCRHSKEATRQLDYLVRCKPLADSVIHLNHTEIEAVAPGARQGTSSGHHVATYSLPPLKLNLFDCCIPGSSSSTVVERTWDQLLSIRDQST